MMKQGELITVMKLNGGSITIDFSQYWLNKPEAKSIVLLLAKLVENNYIVEDEIKNGIRYTLTAKGGGKSCLA